MDRKAVIEDPGQHGGEVPDAPPCLRDAACIRIEFKTDSLNERSRRAILRIAAVEEGVLRNHVITADGRIRHSVLFSITAHEWPGVRKRLEGMLGIA